MSRLLTLPKVLLPTIFQFLTTRDIVALESVCLTTMHMSRAWFGDAQSQRIRPLMIRDTDSARTFHDVLASTYLPDLILWSLAFRHVAKNRHARPKRKRFSERTSPPNRLVGGRHIEDDIQTDLPSEVLNYLFSSSTFRNDHMTKQPSNEQAWQNAIAQIHPYFYYVLDAIYDVGTREQPTPMISLLSSWQLGLTKMSAWSDRVKLMFMEKAARRGQCLSKPSDDVSSIIKLSIRALSLILPSRSAMALRFAKYALWTVWGPAMLSYNDEKCGPILHATQLPPTQPLLQPHQMILLNQALIDNLPLPDMHIKWSTMQTMYQLRAMHMVRWYLHPSFNAYVDVVSDSSHHPLMIINVYRVKHVYVGMTLQHRIAIYPQQIHIDYIINNIQTNESQIVFTAKYDPMVPRVQEPPEVMCWKYLPIQSVECHFACVIQPPIQDRSFVNRMHPKILMKQQQHIEHLLQTSFWTAMDVPAPSVPVFVHPKFSVVNNCVWNVFYSCC